MWNKVAECTLVKESIMFGIFLDDERSPKDVTWIEYPNNINWHIVRNREQFEICLHDYMDHHRDQLIVSFDHDLGEYMEDGRENSGYDALKYMLDELLKVDERFPVCFFHTQNIIGRENMEKYYRNFLEFTYRNREICNYP